MEDCRWRELPMEESRCRDPIFPCHAVDNLCITTGCGGYVVLHIPVVSRRGRVTLQ